MEPREINKKPLHENTTGHFNATSLKLTPIKSGVKKGQKGILLTYMISSFEVEKLFKQS